MIGILNFKNSSLLCLSMTFCVAAEIDLTGDSRLSGKVLSISGEGIITLSTPLSDEPLLLNVDHVEKVDFKTSDQSNRQFDQGVTLINGDTFPISIEALNEDSLKATSLGMGKLDIPRALIDSVQFGLFTQETIYSGPSDFSGWQRDSSGSRNWTFKDNAIRVRGSGMLSRDVAFPEKYIISFRLRWQAEPRFQLSFADTLNGGARRDRYLLEFDASGLDIKREAAAAKRSTPIVMVGKKPEKFEEKELTVEIRVNQSTARLELHVDGQLIGRYTDPIPETPSGSGIALISHGDGGSEQFIDRIEITEWDDRSDRFRSENRGDATMDSIIDRLGDRFGGRLLSIENREEGKVYMFRSVFHEQPIELAESDISTVFFAKASDFEKTSEGLVMHLKSGGMVHANGYEFGEESIRMSHPLLGELTLDRSVVTRLERSQNARKRKGDGKP